MRALLVGVVVLVLAAAGVAADKAQDLIVGKWEPTDGAEKGLLEINKDGTLKATRGGETREGKWKLVGENQLELEFMGRAIKLKVAVTKDELTTTNEENNRTTKFKRAK